MSSPSLASQLSPLSLSAKELLLTTKAINADVAMLQQQSNSKTELFSPLSRAYLSGVRGSKAKPSGLGCVTKMTEAEIGGFASESKIPVAPPNSGDKAVSLTQSSLRGTGGKIRAVKRHLLSSTSSAHLLAGLILDAIHATKASNAQGGLSANLQQQTTPFGPSKSFKAGYAGPLGSIREQLAAELHERGLDATYRVAAAKFLQRRLAQEREWGALTALSASNTSANTITGSSHKRFIGAERIASGELAAEMQAALESLTQKRGANLAGSSDATKSIDIEGDDKVATFNESDELDDALLDDALDDLLG